jgi:hypothetical protein
MKWPTAEALATRINSRCGAAASNGLTEYLQVTPRPRRTEFSLRRQSACQQRGTHHGLGSPSDTLEECFLPA